MASASCRSTPAGWRHAPRAGFASGMEPRRRRSAFDFGPSSSARYAPVGMPGPAERPQGRKVEGRRDEGEGRSWEARLRSRDARMPAPGPRAPALGSSTCPPETPAGKTADPVKGPDTGTRNLQPRPGPLRTASPGKGRDTGEGTARPAWKVLSACFSRSAGWMLTLMQWTPASLSALL